MFESDELHVSLVPLAHLEPFQQRLGIHFSHAFQSGPPSLVDSKVDFIPNFLLIEDQGGSCRLYRVKPTGPLGGTEPKNAERVLHFF